MKMRYAFLCSFMHDMCRTHVIFLDLITQINNIWWGMQIMYLCIVQFSAPYCQL